MSKYSRIDNSTLTWVSQTQGLYTAMTSSGIECELRRIPGALLRQRWAASHGSTKIGRFQSAAQGAKAIDEFIESGGRTE